MCGVALSEAPPHSGEGVVPVPQLTQWVVQKSRRRRSVGGQMTLFPTVGAGGVYKNRIDGVQLGTVMDYFPIADAMDGREIVPEVLRGRVFGDFWRRGGWLYRNCGVGYRGMRYCDDTAMC